MKAGMFALLLGVAVLPSCAPQQPPEPPLIAAAKESNDQKVLALLDKGADVNATDQDGYTALVWASADSGQKSNAGIVKLLLDRGADINHQSNNGSTALMCAASLGHADVVRLLLARGADPTIRDRDGTMAREWAAKYGHMNIVALLDDPSLLAQGQMARVRAQVRPLPDDAAAFEQIARDYRAASPKPVPGEDVHRLRVQADDSMQRKQFAEAANLYGQAVQMAPWWPQGHFNRALILAEIGLYRDAAQEMRRYLSLVPDAADARAAQDKIYVWESRETAPAGQLGGGPPVSGESNRSK